MWSGDAGDATQVTGSSLTGGPDREGTKDVDPYGRS